jgi:hypothetical protein
MASFENTVVIQRSVEEVLAFLADVENLPNWNDAIGEPTKTSPGPVGSEPPTTRPVRSRPGAKSASS